MLKHLLSPVKLVRGDKAIAIFSGFGFTFAPLVKRCCIAEYSRSNSTISSFVHNFSRLSSAALWSLAFEFLDGFWSNSPGITIRALSAISDIGKFVANATASLVCSLMNVLPAFPDGRRKRFFRPWIIDKCARSIDSSNSDLDILPHLYSWSITIGWSGSFPSWAPATSTRCSLSSAICSSLTACVRPVRPSASSAEKNGYLLAPRRRPLLPLLLQGRWAARNTGITPPSHPHCCSTLIVVLRTDTSTRRGGGGLWPNITSTTTVVHVSIAGFSHVIALFFNRIAGWPLDNSTCRPLVFPPENTCIFIHF